MKSIRYPRGYNAKGFRQVAIRFDEELFQLILTRAKREKKDFNTMVKELCRVGELDLADSDQYEPKTVREREEGATSRA
jgi:hypothetical protein